MKSSVTHFFFNKQYKNSTIKYAYELIGYQTMAEDLEPLRYGMNLHAVIVFVRGL